MGGDFVSARVQTEEMTSDGQLGEPEDATADAFLRLFWELVTHHCKPLAMAVVSG